MNLKIIFAPLLFATMMDLTMTHANTGYLAFKQEIFSLNVAKLIEYIYARGYKVTLGEAWRTHDQALIYAKVGSGIVNSLHCQRLALDFNLVAPDGSFCFDDRHYLPFGEYWESLHPSNRWGGRFVHRKDVDHVEMD